MFKLFYLIVRNLRRSLGRTLLTGISVFSLVFVVTLILSILSFLDSATSTTSSDLKGIVTEKWSLPSQMPYSYADRLCEGGIDPSASDDTTLKPVDTMTWQFYAGSVDPNQKGSGNTVFAIALEPKKLLTMMDELDSLQGEVRMNFEVAVDLLEKNTQGIILGQQRLRNLGRKVGDRLTLHGFAFYRELQLELEIVGVFPAGRYDSSAAIQRDYYNRVIDAFPSTHQGRSHPLADKSLNAVWYKVRSPDELSILERQIQSTGWFSQPAVKLESVAAGLQLLMTGYSDLIAILRWVLVPAILFALGMVITNSIAISVRQRNQEFAILKILGFRPLHILSLILGESLLVGVLAGGISSVMALLLVNKWLGGIAFPIAFFTKFYIDNNALWWGAAIGSVTAVVGSFPTAYKSSRQKPAEVFSRA